MNKFCDICKLTNKCRFCFKYGSKGVYMYLQDKQFRMQRIEERKVEIYPEYSNIDIDKVQLQAFGRK